MTDFRARGFDSPAQLREHLAELDEESPAGDPAVANGDEAAKRQVAALRREVADLRRELGQLDQIAQAARVSELLGHVLELEAYRRELAAVGQDES